MYEDFKTKDPLTGEVYHCIYQALIVGIATRHSDTVDIKFLVNGKPMWLGLPHPAWVEFRRRTGQRLSDRMAVDLAGLYLKRLIEDGQGVDRQHWNDITVDDVMQLADSLGWVKESSRPAAAEHPAPGAPAQPAAR